MKSLRFSLRYLSKARNGNITRVVSLTLGLAVSLLIFSYVGFLLSFDRCYPDNERIYQVWVKYNMDGGGFGSLIHYPMGPALEQDIPQVEATTRVLRLTTTNMKSGESVFECKYWPVDTSFFDVFGLKQISGDDPHKIFNSKDQIMISRSLARKSFAGNDPVGQTVQVENKYEGKMVDFVVAGVFEDLPINTFFQDFNMLVPLDLLVKSMGMGTGWNGGDSYYTFFKLAKGSHIEDIERLMPSFAEKYGLKENMEKFKKEYAFFTIAKSNKIYGSSYETLSFLLSAVAFLLLFIAAMNYVLISVSGMVKRSRTIALLKCNGAHRGDIFRIFLWETALLLVCALALAVMILLACAKPIEQITTYPVDELFAFGRIWIPTLVVLSVFMLSGLIPARLFTRVPVEAAFKGLADANKRWKKGLLGVEIACVTCVAALLLITVLQFKFVRYGDFGYEPNNLIITQIAGSQSQIDRYVREFESLPEVASVSRSYSLPIFGYNGMPCVDENTRDILFNCRWEVADYNYIPTMGMKIVEGEDFSDFSKPTDAIVNQKYVSMRGWKDSPIGHQIMDSSNENARVFTIVGVVNDFRMHMKGDIMPLVIHPFSMVEPGGEWDFRYAYITIRLNKMSRESISAVSDKIDSFKLKYTNMGVYNDMIDTQLHSLISLRQIMEASALVTLFIALIGLLGYLSDECNRRAREIAIRKVNGAGVREILSLLARNTFVLVVVSVAVGAAGSYFIAGKMLEMFPSKIALSWWIFAATAAGVMVLVYVIQGVKTWRTANSNPSAMLKAE